jgi:hypothetical protein
MNLAQHLDKIYSDLGEPNRNRFPVYQLKNWIDDAERTINNLTKCIFAYAEVDSVADQQEYSFPTDILNYSIDKIYYSDSDSTERILIDPVDKGELDAFAPSWKNTNGTPCNWFVSRETRKYGFYPFEKTVRTGTNCILLYYRKKHTKMTRLYETGTITVVNGSSVVTGASTAFVGNVVAGDQIGLGKLLDETRATDFPVTWYTVQSVDSDTQLTLTENYAGVSASAQSYIASAVSSILFDELNECSCILAMSKSKFKDGDYNGETALEGRAISKANAFKYDIEHMAASYAPMAPIGELMMPKGGKFRDDYGSYEDTEKWR